MLGVIKLTFLFKEDSLILSILNTAVLPFEQELWMWLINNNLLINESVQLFYVCEISKE